MSDLTCPRCGESLPPNSPAGLCPRCLMRMNMATQTRLGGEEAAPGTALPPTAEEIARHFPNFDIVECLGRGGMGVVYQARQKSLNRLVALKIVAPEREKDAAFARRFALEAETLAKLNHPGIVTIYDFGQADGLFYLVMEFVDGVTLRRLLDAGRVSPREALAIVPQICDALQYAHDQGIVHRDIKPENILLDRRGRVKVADFGVARLIGISAEAGADSAQASASSTLSGGGKVIGTPSYMAPEQKEHPAEVDHRADIYALGVVLYQMLTGELPGPHPQPPSKKVQIDVRLDEVVLRALEKEPQRRYQQAGDVKTAVETIAGSSAAQPQPPEALKTGSLQGRLQPVASDTFGPRRRWLYVFAAGILTALLLEGAAIGVESARTDSNRGDLVFGLLCGAIAIVIFFLVRKPWLGGFLACLGSVFLLWIGAVALMTGAPWLGLAAAVAACAVFCLILRKSSLPRSFLSGFFVVHVLVFGLSGLVTWMMPESFLSTARLVLSPKAGEPLGKLPIAGPFATYDPYRIQTELEVIQSEAVLGKVIQDLDLNREWGKRVNGGLTLESRETLFLLKRALDVRPVRNSNMMVIRVFGDTPAEPAAIANRIAQVYQACRKHSEPGAERQAGIVDPAKLFALGDTLLSQNGALQVDIVDTAKPGLRPVRPNKPLNLAFGALAGLLLGTATGAAIAGRKAHDS